jgi:lipopolysaccharide transport system ATP-binding protein
MKPIIEVSNLSKSYNISHQHKPRYHTIKDDLTNFLKKPIGGGGGEEDLETFWALKDINFEVQQGDVFGIVGKNGSGKSTLLKILSRIVDPTTGHIAIHGRVASLLEVGTGFHPELTGRENIYFNGSMIGMNRREINTKFNEIVAFSEIEQFLDTPVKFYSSGMYVRLAFAVAAHLEPDVLIIDEVLAVGDTAFQKKCMNKILKDAKEGRTILFVSHSMTTVEQLCDKAMLLEKGKIKYIGETEFVTQKYLNKNMPVQTDTKFEINPKKDAQFLAIELQDLEGNKLDAVNLDEPWVLYMKYKSTEPCEQTMVAVEILDNQNQPVYLTADSDHKTKLGTLEPGLYEAKIIFDKVSFSPSVYTVRSSIQSPGRVVHDTHDNLVLRVRSNPKDVRSTYFKGKYMGHFSTKLDWDVTKKPLSHGK